jgi:hypothetical protein
MRHAESLCQHAAATLVATLSEKDLVRLGTTSKQAVVEKVTAALLENFRQEEALEKEAEQLAESHLRAAPGLDRHKVIQLIKQRLAEDRRFVL